MTTRVIYTSYQAYMFHCASILRKECDWIPVLWHVNETIEKDVISTFQNCHTYNAMDAIKGKLPEFISEEDLVSIDSSFLTEMAYYESIALNMLNRNFLIDDFLYQDRFRLYVRLLRIFQTILLKMKPDVIVMEDSPHQACDYILYILAQRNNIITIFPEEAVIPKRFVLMNRYEDGNKKILKEYLDLINKKDVISSIQLSDYALTEINKKRADYTVGIPYYMIQQTADFEGKFKGITIKKIIQGIIHYFKVFNVFKFNKRFKSIIELRFNSIHNYIKVKGKNFEDSNISNWNYLKQIKKIDEIKKDNLSYYRSIQLNNPNLKVPYVFCALHLQPEKTSSPWGGYYANQYLMIQLLSKAIPAHWKIYIKEHLSQFIHPSFGEAYRNPTFYDDIKNLKNVEFLPLEFKSFELIDNSIATASLSGQVLWESVLRGKPSLAFGEGHFSWCGGCEGIFYTPTVSHINDVIKKIQDGYTIDINKVLLYASIVEKNSYHGYLGGHFQQQFHGTSPEENGKVHAQAIKDFVNLNPVNSF